INEAGDVGGTVWVGGNSTHAFVLRNGVKTVLDNLGGAWGNAYGIDPQGRVLGWSGQADGELIPVVWTDVTPTPLKSPGRYASVHAGNLAGVHVGAAWRHDQQVALRWSRAGRPSELGSLGGGASYAAAINRAGVIVGAATDASGTYRAFRHDGAGMQDLGTLVPGLASHATAINRHGEVVGVADVSATAQRAVRFTDSGVVDLGTLGGDDARALGLNDRGDVVGESTFGDLDHPWRTRALLVRNGRMHNLQSLLQPQDQALWHLTTAESINNAGQIMARARAPGTGYYDAVLVRLDPVD
ncbi:MAG: hypothetical protein J0M20_18350, partial [Burkholderiales bacterium]|nr:hypothetical protein [Burkholderiales bacterium]